MARAFPVRKAVIPVAGLGTRLRPVTRAIPKGMLPVIDTPVVQYVVDEAAAAGLADVMLVIGQDQDAFRTYFGPARERSRGEVSIGFLTQDPPRGLGDAVLRCAGFVGKEPFAILFGDNILSAGDDLLTRMIAARKKYGGTILALIETSGDDISARAVAAFGPTDDAGVVRITDLIEKPDASGAPSNWIMIGRCVCDPAVFRVLRETPPGYGGEIQLSDALRTLAHADRAAGGGVHGLLFRGRRYDTGNRQDYLRTTVELACSRPDIAEQFLPWLRRYVSAES
jgi:UTP--glucose-1-phosphate uridylyltransferase